MTFEELLVGKGEFIVETGSLQEADELRKRYREITSGRDAERGWVDLRFKGGKYAGWGLPHAYRGHPRWVHVQRYAWSDICGTANEAEDEEPISGLLSLLE